MALDPTVELASCGAATEWDVGRCTQINMYTNASLGPRGGAGLRPRCPGLSRTPRTLPQTSPRKPGSRVLPHVRMDAPTLQRSLLRIAQQEHDMAMQNVETYRHLASPAMVKGTESAVGVDALGPSSVYCKSVPTERPRAPPSKSTARPNRASPTPFSPTESLRSPTSPRGEPSATETELKECAERLRRRRAAADQVLLHSSSLAAFRLERFSWISCISRSLMATTCLPALRPRTRQRFQTGQATPLSRLLTQVDPYINHNVVNSPLSR